MLVNVHYSGDRTPFRYLYRDAKRDVVMLHDSIGVAESFFDFFPKDDRTFFVVNFGWYLNDMQINAVRRALERIQDLAGHATDMKNRLLVLCNSDAELAFFKSDLPDVRAIKVSNCFTLSSQEMCIVPLPARYDFAYIANPWRYKNLHLVPPRESGLVISGRNPGDRNEAGYVDITSFLKTQIHYNLDRPEIRVRLNQSKCGLIFSAQEGACYASAEYLLCGLPVISTKSVGGRDEYYTDYNAVIVEADADHILEAWQRTAHAFDRGQVDRERIRNSALDRQAQFRSALAGTLNEMAGIPVADFLEHLEASIAADSKLWKSINYWSSALELAPS